MEISLPGLSDLPEKVTPPNGKTLCVMLTYRRVVGYFKSGKETLPAFGGAVAEYPREKGFILDKDSLLPTL